MMTRYDIDFEKLVTWLLPSFKRKPIRIAWLYRSLKGLRNIHADFMAFGQERIDQAQIQSQVIILENYLIERFGAGIVIYPEEVATNLSWIADDEDPDLSYIGDDADASSFFFIADDEDTSSSGVNATVQVPASLGVDEDELRAVLDKYKVPGSTYTIEYI